MSNSIIFENLLKELYDLSLKDREVVAEDKPRDELEDSNDRLRNENARLSHLYKQSQAEVRELQGQVELLKANNNYKDLASSQDLIIQELREEIVTLKLEQENIKAGYESVLMVQESRVRQVDQLKEEICKLKGKILALGEERRVVENKLSEYVNLFGRAKDLIHDITSLVE